MPTAFNDRQDPPGKTIMAEHYRLRPLDPRQQGAELAIREAGQAAAGQEGTA